MYFLEPLGFFFLLNLLGCWEVRWLYRWYQPFHVELNMFLEHVLDCNALLLWSIVRTPWLTLMFFLPRRHGHLLSLTDPPPPPLPKPNRPPRGTAF